MKKRLKQTAWVGALLAFMILITGLTGCAAPPQMSAAPSEQATTKVSVNETENKQEKIKWFELDWSQQTPELKRLNDLTLEDFRQESLDNQLLYYSFLNWIYFENYLRGEFGPNEDMLHSKNEVSSLEDSAQEIVEQEKNKLEIATTAVNEDGNFDSIEGRKLLSAIVYDIKEAIANIDPSTNGFAYAEKRLSKVPEGQKYSQFSIDPVTGKDRSEVKYYKDNTPYVSFAWIDPDGDAYEMEYVFWTFKNFEGKEQSIWLRSKATQQ